METREIQRKGLTILGFEGEEKSMEKKSGKNISVRIGKKSKKGSSNLQVKGLHLGGGSSGGKISRVRKGAPGAERNRGN